MAETYTAEQRAAIEAKCTRLMGFGLTEREARSAAENDVRGLALGSNPPPTRRKTHSTAEGVFSGGSSREPAEMPRTETAADLMRRDMPTIARLNDFISEGLNITVARPKFGKSTLGRQKLAAAAVADLFMSRPTKQADGLLLSLEEGERLVRAKFEQAGFHPDALARIRLAYEWRRGTDGVLDLMRYLDANPGIGLVVIDSLTKFRAVPDARTQAFVADYEAVSALHAVAKERPGLCIDVLHHTRKMSSDDPLDCISGTFGISAAVDSYCVMKHHEDGALAHFGGRLWEHDKSEFLLRRANQRWELVGEFTGLTAPQSELLEILRASKGLGPSEVARTLSIGRAAAYERLSTLMRNGFVESRNGRYYAKSL